MCVARLKITIVLPEMTKNYSNRSCGEETESRNVYKTPVIVHYCVVVSVPEEDMDIFDFSKFGDIKPSSRAHFNAGHPFYVETLTNSSLTVDFLCLTAKDLLNVRELFCT